MILPTRACHARIQTLRPGVAIDNRSHSPLASRTGRTGSCPGSLNGNSDSCDPFASISCRNYPEYPPPAPRDRLQPSRGLKNPVTVWVLCQLPQAARTSENRIKARNRAARRIQDQNQRIQGPNCTNRSTRIPHPVFNPCSEPVELDSVFGNGRCQRRSARGQAETV